MPVRTRGKEFVFVTIASHASDFIFHNFWLSFGISDSITAMLSKIILKGEIESKGKIDQFQ